MTRYLLDVNILLALIWPPHESHTIAQAWFARSGRHAWATNALTQLGVLRLLTNPAITQTAVTALGASELLRQNTTHSGHEFWTLDTETPSGIDLMATRVRGHQQWTDALLLWQAKEHGGVFVTFDSAAKELAAGEFKNHLLVLKAT